MDIYEINARNLSRTLVALAFAGGVIGYTMLNNQHWFTNEEIKILIYILLLILTGSSSILLIYIFTGRYFENGYSLNENFGMNFRYKSIIRGFLYGYFISLVGWVINQEVYVNSIVYNIGIVTILSFLCLIWVEAKKLFKKLMLEDSRAYIDSLDYRFIFMVSHVCIIILTAAMTFNDIGRQSFNILN